MFQVLVAPGSKSSLQKISLNSNKQKICFGNHGLDPRFFIGLERSGLSLNCFSGLKSKSQGCPFTAVLPPITPLVLGKLKKELGFFVVSA